MVVLMIVAVIAVGAVHMAVTTVRGAEHERFVASRALRHGGGALQHFLDAVHII